MDIDMRQNNLLKTFRCIAVSTLCVSMLSVTSLTFADFAAVGDVTPSTFNDDNFDGGSTGAMEIGVDDLGGISGDDEQVFGGVQPLESTSVSIGVMDDGIGAVTLTGFVSQWDISGDLTLGDAGQGFLSMGASATVDVDGSTIIGAQATGQGIVDITGATFPGARLRTSGDLIVGDLGSGTVRLSTRGSLLSEANAIVGNQDGANGTVTLADLGTRWSVQGDLTVGNGTTGSTAYGNVEISNDALLQAEGAVTINPSGTITLLGGTLRTVPSTTTVIANSGIIRGDGFINGAMTIGVGGLLSNSAADVQNGSTVINLREDLRISGEVINDGRIETIGGKMRFDSLVTNNNVIHVRDAIIDFANTPPEDGVDDLINTDLLVFGGDISATGDINNIGGDMFMLDDTTLLLQGNLIFTSGIFGIAANGEGPPISVTGEADLSGATIDLVLTSGFAPAVGESFALLQADDGIMFPLNMADSAGGTIFNFSVVGNTLFAENTGSLVMPMGADFNGDGMVNALDLQIWEDNYPIASGATTLVGDADGDGDVDGSDFMKIQRDFGVMPVPPIVAVTAAVPEPSTMVMALLTLVCCPRRRSQS